MSIDELVTALLNRGSGLVVREGQLRHLGPSLAADDPIRAAIAAHRTELLRLFTPAAELCVWQDAPLAPGDRIACPEHRHQLDAAVMPWDARAQGGRAAA